MNKEKKISLSEFYNLSEEDQKTYEIWDEEQQCWVSYETSCYYSDNTFPKPEEAKYPINLITVYSSKTKEYYTWGNKHYTGDNPLVQNYFCFEDEKELLTNFIKWFSDQDFNILTGWNVCDFDVQYILNRKEKLGIKANLTKLNKYYQKTTFKLITDKQGRTMKRKVYYCKIAGLSILDSLELYRKFTFEPLESYSLNFVAYSLELDGKIELEGHVNNEWKHNWNRFVVYNVQDVILVKQIDDIKKHIALAIQLASESLIPIDRVFSSIATVEGYILRDLHKNNIVMSDRKSDIHDLWKDKKLYKCNGYLQNVKEGEKTFSDFYVKGGHVEANPGIYNDVMSYDLTSLYPHNMIQFNVSPEVKVFDPSPERIAKGDLIRTPVNGIYYLKNKRGIIPQLVEKIFNERKEFKKLKFKYLNEGNKKLGDYYDAQQHIRKILINSYYGILNNRYSHFYDVDNARVITRSGRVLIRYLSKTTDKYIKECWHIIAKKHFPDLKEYPKIKNDIVSLLDTDSLYLNTNEIKNKYASTMQLKDFCHKMDKEVFEPFYEKILKIYADKYNANQVHNFKREDIIVKQLILAKKKYIKLCLQSEDEVYEIPKLKATGGEIVKSDVPKLCREMIKETVNVLFKGDVPNKDAVVKHLKRVKKNYKTEKKEDISFGKSVSEYTKYAEPTSVYVQKKAVIIKKRTPIHVRASMYYNYMVEKYHLPYNQINNGMKLKYVYVNPKNILGTNAVAFVGNWPKEFDKYFEIDYTLQFQKSFLNAIQNIFDVMKWGGINLRAGGLNKFMKRKKKNV